MKTFIHEEIQLISFHDYKEKRVLIFKKTCGACPCQYDIYDSWENCDKPKYYGRLRWGYFYVAKEPCEEPIYEFNFKDDMQGAFYDSVLEIEHLKKACQKIWEQKSNKIKKHKSSKK